MHAVCASEIFTLKIQFSTGTYHDFIEDRKLINPLSYKDLMLFIHGPLLTKTKERQPLRLGEGLFQLSIRRKEGNYFGNMMQNFINDATKLSAFFSN